MRLIDAHPQLSRVPSRWGINPFTRGPLLFKSKPDTARVLMEQNPIGFIHWALNDTCRLIVAGRFPVEFFTLDEIPHAGKSEGLNELAVIEADLTRPVILAEIAPGRYNLIDGHHPRIIHSISGREVTVPLVWFVAVPSGPCGTDLDLRGGSYTRATVRLGALHPNPAYGGS